MSHTFSVKFRVFRREFLRNYSVYWAQIFRDNWNCYALSIFRVFILLASSDSDKLCVNAAKRVNKDLPIRRVAEYFWRISRCFIWWWNTVSNAWHYLSNKMILELEIKDAKLSSFSNTIKHFKRRNPPWNWIILIFRGQKSCTNQKNNLKLLHSFLHFSRPKDVINHLK